MKEKKAKGRPRMKIDMEKVSSRWGEGKSIKEIAEELNVAYCTIRRRLKELGCLN